MDAFLDRMAIRELLDRYCYGLDRRSFPALKPCFTKDADLWYFNGMQNIKGGDDIETLCKNLAPCSVRDHYITSLKIDLDEKNKDYAKADFHITATLLKSESNTICVRVIQMHDELIRTNETTEFRGWQISKRDHIPMAQFDMPAAKIDLPGFGGKPYGGGRAFQF